MNWQENLKKSIGKSEVVAELHFPTIVEMFKLVGGDTLYFKYVTPNRQSDWEICYMHCDSSGGFYRDNVKNSEYIPTNYANFIDFINAWKNNDSVSKTLLNGAVL